MIGSIALLPRKFHAYLVPSAWVITQAINCRLKLKTCLQSESELFYRFNKDKQISFTRLDKGEKGTNLAQELVSVSSRSLTYGRTQTRD